MTADDFSQFVTAVRAGDQAAAEELVRRYEPLIRRAVRLRLRDSALRRVFDSMDICQSIMASFFNKAAQGEFQLGNWDDLAALLMTMARNKLATRARRAGAINDGLPAEWDAADPRPTPDAVTEQVEEAARIRTRLTPEELRLFELNKVQRRRWEQIAEELGEKPATLRIRLSRGLARVRKELHEEDDHVA